jgi:hypothetical protein
MFKLDSKSIQTLLAIYHFLKRDNDEDWYEDTYVSLIEFVGWYFEEGDLHDKSEEFRKHLEQVDDLPWWGFVRRFILDLKFYEGNTSELDSIERAQTDIRNTEIPPTRAELKHLLLLPLLRILNGDQYLDMEAMEEQEGDEEDDDGDEEPSYSSLAHMKYLLGRCKSEINKLQNNVKKWKRKYKEKKQELHETEYVDIG